MDNEQYQQTFSRALDIILHQINKEVKHVAGTTTDSLIDCPLVLDHRILRSEAHAPYLKRIISQIKSSENAARRISEGVKRAPNSPSVANEEERLPNFDGKHEVNRTIKEQEEPESFSVISSTPHHLTCSYCGKRLSSRQTLADHQNIHTGDRRKYTILSAWYGLICYYSLQMRLSRMYEHFYA